MYFVLIYLLIGSTRADSNNVDICAPTNTNFDVSTDTSLQINLNTIEITERQIRSLTCDCTVTLIGNTEDQDDAESRGGKTTKVSRESTRTVSNETSRQVSKQVTRNNDKSKASKDSKESKSKESNDSYFETTTEIYLSDDLEPFTRRCYRTDPRKGKCRQLVYTYATSPTRRITHEIYGTNHEITDYYKQFAQSWESIIWHKITLTLRNKTDPPQHLGRITILFNEESVVNVTCQNQEFPLTDGIDDDVVDEAVDDDKNDKVVPETGNQKQQTDKANKSKIIGLTFGVALLTIITVVLAIVVLVLYRARKHMKNTAVGSDVDRYETAQNVTVDEVGTAYIAISDISTAKSQHHEFDEYVTHSSPIIDSTNTANAETTSATDIYSTDSATAPSTEDTPTHSDHNYDDSTPTSSDDTDDDSTPTSRDDNDSTPTSSTDSTTTTNATENTSTVFVAGNGSEEASVKHQPSSIEKKGNSKMIGIAVGVSVLGIVAVSFVIGILIIYICRKRQNSNTDSTYQIGAKDAVDNPVYHRDLQPAISNDEVSKTNTEEMRMQENDVYETVDTDMECHSVHVASASLVGVTTKQDELHKQGNNVNEHDYVTVIGNSVYTCNENQDENIRMQENDVYETGNSTALPITPFIGVILRDRYTPPTIMTSATGIKHNPSANGTTLNDNHEEIYMEKNDVYEIGNRSRKASTDGAPSTTPR